MNRITLTRAEAVALLLLTGPGAPTRIRENMPKALKTFPEFKKVLDAVTIRDVDSAIYKLVDAARPQLAQFNEEIINKERLEKERAAERVKQDLFYKNVTGLLKKLNDTTWLTGQERLELASTRYPEADVRLNRLDKLEYFGRKNVDAVTPAHIRQAKADIAAGFAKEVDNSLATLLKNKLTPPRMYGKVDF